MIRKDLTFLFIPLDAYGHINACVGIGQRIHSHGHRVVFALERAWTGVVAKYPGLEEVHYVDKSRDASLGPNEYWINMMDHLKQTFALDPIECLKRTDFKMMESFFHNFLNVHDGIVSVLEQVKPDIIVCDTYVTIPAVLQSGIPWVWITSAQPLSCLPGPDLPPARTGYPTKGDRAQWKEYLDLAIKLNMSSVIRFNDRLKNEFNLPPTPPGSFCHPSPYLNMYAYPSELDYQDIRPLPENWLQLDHFVRVEKPDSNFVIPESFLNVPIETSKLIYVSMGSMGCADLELMSRLIRIFSKSSHRFIFSLGPLETKLKPLLSTNMWGAKFVPQTLVLQLVDLVITHGGNNSFVEALYYGKPMLVTPLFMDQLDNAQRITEVGLGLRANPYTAEPAELLEMIEQLLSDEKMHAQLRKLSQRLQHSQSTEKAALAIERLVL